MNALLFALALSLTGHPAGWFEDDLDAALAAAAPDGVVIVDVGAAWCAPCNDLQSEVLDTPTGIALVRKGDAGLAVDFDSPAGKRIAKRLAVISLPTALVLDARGLELGRVEGYTRADAWLEAMADARAGKAGLDALAARAAAHPQDLEAQIDLAWAKLARGDDPTAIATLERVIRAGGDAGARAGRVLGRWFLRVKDDPARGVAHFQKLVKRFAKTPYGPGFRYWLALAHHAAGDDDAARAVFARWKKDAPRSADPLLYEADFLVESGFPDAEARPVVLKALSRNPREPDLHYLLAKLELGRRAIAEAHDAINRAIDLDPGAARYQNFARNLPHIPAPPAAEETGGPE
ncbi:MAG: tetratricopeptide repeat protein [Deltaproteobacteria bacterium]|nr:MAG: tetratricopeptide repeat protein [Deltaproteobacteria bacterium]